MRIKCILYNNQKFILIDQMESGNDVRFRDFRASKNNNV